MCIDALKGVFINCSLAYNWLGWVSFEGILFVVVVWAIAIENESETNDSCGVVRIVAIENKSETNNSCGFQTHNCSLTQYFILLIKFSHTKQGLHIINISFPHFLVGTTMRVFQGRRKSHLVFSLSETCYSFHLWHVLLSSMQCVSCCSRIGRKWSELVMGLE